MSVGIERSKKLIRPGKVSNVRTRRAEAGIDAIMRIAERHPQRAREIANEVDGVGLDSSFRVLIAWTESINPNQSVLAWGLILKLAVYKLWFDNAFGADEQDRAILQKYFG